MKDLITLADAMDKKHFIQGDKIIRFGDIGSEYFILSSGRVSVTVYQPGSNPFDPRLQDKITVIKELSSEPDMIGFGEIALLLNDRRTASITALSAEGCDAWVLAADVFKYIIASNTIRRRNINLSYLSQVELFKNIE
jgi:CRP-like cAMP-binding protein